MKKLKIIGLVTVIVIGCSILGNASLPYKPRITPRRQQRDRLEWVEKCLADFESIKPGMKRSEVEKRMSIDGGLQFMVEERLCHPECSYFKIDVSFDVKHDPNDQNRAVISEEDKVLDFSKPYIERPIMD
jgi:hypothetical protein